MKGFISNLWKTQPNIVLGGISAIILIAGYFGLVYEPKKEVEPRVLTPQEVVDEYEFKMRRICKEQIQSKLDTPEPYKVEKIRFTPHMMNNPPSAVVNLRVNFIGRKDGLINAWFARCSFNLPHLQILVASEKFWK